jgi:hypothetical protein
MLVHPIAFFIKNHEARICIYQKESVASALDTTKQKQSKAKQSVGSQPSEDEDMG